MISFTRYRAATGCRLAYAWRYLERRHPTNTPAAFQRGTDFHHMLRAAVETGDVSALHPNVAAFIASHPGPWEWEVKAERDGIMGYIDAVPSEGVVVEIKSYPTTLPAHREQLRLYEFLTDAEEVWLLTPMDAFRLDPDPDEAARVADLVRRTVEAVEEEIAEKGAHPQPSGQCAYCPFIHACPAPHPYAGDPARAVEAALRLQAELIALKEFLKEVAKEQGGAVETEYARAWFKPITRTHVDPREFFALAADAGLDPLDYMTVDLRKFRRLASKSEAFANIAEVKSAPRFTVEPKK